MTNMTAPTDPDARARATLRNRLAYRLANVESDLARATTELAQLRDDVGDDQLAEGFAGDDIATLLRDAARDVRTAMAVLDKATGAGQ